VFFLGFRPLPLLERALQRQFLSFD
jgi:hypothetical protein